MLQRCRPRAICTRAQIRCGIKIGRPSHPPTHCGHKWPYGQSQYQDNRVSPYIFLSKVYSLYLSPWYRFPLTLRKGCKNVVSHSRNCTCSMITHSWFETALDYFPHWKWGKKYAGRHLDWSSYGIFLQHFYNINGLIIRCSSMHHVLDFLGSPLIIPEIC
jgi:hypothetical protein